MNTVKHAVIACLDRVMSRRLRNSLFHLSFHLARSEFNRFAYEIGHAPDMEFGLRAVAKRGLAPKTIIDVGAFEGNWSRMARAIWPESHIIMFEPNRSKKESMDKAAQQLKATTFTELLGAQDNASVAFNVMGTGSSVFAEYSPLDRVVEARSLRRLDSILRSIEGPALLKIDTQGYELEVLKGATALLKDVEAILLEVAVIGINEGAPLLHEVLPFMSNIGFVTYEIVEIHRRPLDQATNQIDVLFVRPESQLLQDKRHFA